MHSSQQCYWRKKESCRGNHVISWKTTQKPKEEGGLGFRDLHTLNRALLAKSAWKLCSDSDSMMTKSLKAKYYPDDNLFSLKKKTNTTWSWRSISLELDFVLKHSCWCLGNGKKILIWKNKWIKDLPGPPSPKQGCVSVHQYKHVNQLFTSDSSSWNLTILGELFEPAVISHILKLTIHVQQEDRLVWLLENNGTFSVKSAYRKMSEEQHDHSPANPRMVNIFKTLWKLPLLPRIRHFLWKAVSDLLSTRQTLSKKIPGIVNVCPYCESSPESAAHVLKDCTFPRLVWFAICGLSATNSLSFHDWICSWFEDMHKNKIDCNELCRRAITAWCLWSDRCDKVFSNINPLPDKTIQRCNSYISDHLSLKISSPVKNTRIRRRNIHWIAPPSDTVTLNCDGSYLNNLGGIGLIIRNFAGWEQAARAIHLKDIHSAEQAECRGLWEAVIWADELKLQKVHFELDAQRIVDAVGKNSSIDWRLLNMIKDIQKFFNLNPSWKCYHIPSERNKVADILSKLARIEGLSHTWSSNFPAEIKSQLLEDRAHSCN